MPKLFVDKTIEINAPASKVWNVLTSPEHSSEERVLPKVKALAEKEK